MHEFSELVIARMALLIDQRRSVFPLRSTKAREFGDLWREKCTRAPRTFHLNWPEPVLLDRLERTNGKRHFAWRRYAFPVEKISVCLFKKIDIYFTITSPVGKVAGWKLVRFLVLGFALQQCC